MARRTTANPITVAVKHAAASVSQALVAAPGVGFKLRIWRLMWNVRIAAAQIVDIGVNAGTDAQQLAAIPASGVQPGWMEFDAGFDLPPNTALSSVAALAGPEIRYVVEYNIVPV
jgi:hypothetical protein